MKTLILVRHAKSSWKDPGLSDWERPLNKRGYRDAPRMGQRLNSQSINVDLLVSSTAVRAVTTAELLAHEINYRRDISTKDELYDADADEILAVIHSLGKEKSAMIVAHNPGMTTIINRLSHKFIENVPTCGMAILSYDIQQWSEVGQTKPAHFEFDYPKKK